MDCVWPDDRLLIEGNGVTLIWARRVTELGVGPRPIPRRQLTAERLAAAITIARARAATLGEHIRAKDGVGRAVGMIEQRSKFVFPEEGRERGTR